MRIATILATLSLLLIGTAAVQAHATLERAEPRVGSTVSSAPHEVVLHFTQKLEPSLSTVTVTDASGQRVDSGKPSVSGNVMRVPLRAGGAGTYHVSWRVLSVDTHTTEGTFTFRVGQ